MLIQPATVLNDLTAIVGSANVSVAQADRDLHARDQSHHPASLPDVVVWVETAQQVADILAFANSHQIPVTPWGAGTSLEGNPIPLQQGILMSFDRMDQIVEVYADDFQVRVQPGVTRKQLNQHLARYGLFYAPDPGANATIGGMLANNASGIRTVKYGASKDNVLQMQVALANGQLIQVGARSIKQSSGYDLLHLFVGSEGTLGMITEATLKLAPIPQHMTAMIASFPNVESAIEAVVAVRGSGLDVASLEFLDATATAVITQEGLNIPTQPTLLMEVHATHEASLQLDIEMVREICEEMGATHFQAESDPTRRQQLWEARHTWFEAMSRQNIGMHFFTMDVAVPISAYPQLVAFSREQIEMDNVNGYLLGHAGDGNLHILFPFNKEETHQRIQSVNGRIIHKAIEFGGTSTGEHGVGIGKMSYMKEEHGDALNVMRAIKHTLDPNNILNPGKVIPDVT